MKQLFYKELKLCLPLQVPLFFLFAAMLFIPAYPYLVAWPGSGSRWPSRWSCSC